MISYKQTYPNSCGAASLMCCAIELGITNIPANVNLNPLWVAAHPLSPRGDLQSETMIYAVTSGAAGAPTNNSGYSLPSKIGIAAKALGLTTIAFVPESLTGKLLLALYNSEKIDAQNAGMLLKREAAPVLTENQRLLKILRVGSATSWLPATGLHYVMQRPDLSIMDPGLGQNFPSLDIAIQAHHANGVFYEDTGLAILVV